MRKLLEKIFKRKTLSLEELDDNIKDLENKLNLLNRDNSCYVIDSKFLSNRLMFGSSHYQNRLDYFEQLKFKYDNSWKIPNYTYTVKLNDSIFLGNPITEIFFTTFILWLRKGEFNIPSSEILILQDFEFNLCETCIECDDLRNYIPIKITDYNLLSNKLNSNRGNIDEIVKKQEIIDKNLIESKLDYAEKNWKINRT